MKALLKRGDAELGGLRRGGRSFERTATGLFSIHGENRRRLAVRAAAGKGRCDFCLYAFAEPRGLDGDRGGSGVVRRFDAEDRDKDGKFIEVGEGRFSRTGGIGGHRLPRHGLVVRENVDFHLAVLVGFFKSLYRFLQRGADLRGGGTEGEVFQSGEDFFFIGDRFDHYRLGLLACEVDADAVFLAQPLDNRSGRLECIVPHGFVRFPVAHAGGGINHDGDIPRRLAGPREGALAEHRHGKRHTDQAHDQSAEEPEEEVFEPDFAGRAFLRELEEAQGGEGHCDLAPVLHEMQEERDTGSHGGGDQEERSKKHGYFDMRLRSSR